MTKKDNPDDKCGNCEFGFRTGLEDELNPGHVWCAEAQKWMKKKEWCGLHRYDRELPTREE